MAGPEDDDREGAVSLWRNLPQKEDRRKADALSKLERNWDYAKSAFGVDHRKGWLLEAVEAMEEP